MKTNSHFSTRRSSISGSIHTNFQRQQAESACQFLAALEGSTTLSPLSRLLTLQLPLHKGNLDEAKTIATALIESHSTDTPARSGMLVDETDHSTPPPATPAPTLPTDT
ncbi:hypothetical protein BLNAU_15211 [Blattamonas nauphoetae]|uniref:Uncharacterized protein n=1 Tax=Blattamonas nauphoetae TaxID=2049346 RepID=A0ABQ9XCZ9_9EUKA|nr:hypothetical protein BLNAU_15211 [Blattamonas nauphoetae]